MEHTARNKKAFTLIELLVGMAIFLMAITMVLSLFTAVLRTQRRGIAVQNTHDNARYLLAFIAKEIRMSEISTNDGRVSTLNIYHLGLSVKYQFSGGKILRNDTPINSEEVSISGWFSVDGRAAAGDYEQPQVTIAMKVEVTSGKPEERSVINLQTTVSQRKLD